MPYFSVIIPTYNRFEKTRAAIDSVLAQNFNDFELIVVDDGSTDSTPELEELYTGRIKYLRQENLGVSAARNLGIKHSDSRHTTFLDSDDIWLPKKLSAHYNFIKDNAHIMIHQTDELWIRSGKRVNPKIKHLKREGDIFIDSLDLCLISPSAVCIANPLFEKYGWFDEKLPACEDYDLWLRITPGEKIGLINEGMITRHGGHKDQLSAKYWGMDRFRIYSIIKLLSEKENKLNRSHTECAKLKALEKCRILLLGAEKRENLKFADQIKVIIQHLDDQNYSSIDCQILLEK